MGGRGEMGLFCNAGIRRYAVRFCPIGNARLGWVDYGFDFGDALIVCKHEAQMFRQIENMT